MARLFTSKIANYYEEYYKSRGVNFIKGTVLSSFDFDSNGKVLNLFILIFSEMVCLYEKTNRGPIALIIRVNFVDSSINNDKGRPSKTFRKTIKNTLI